ncbi:MAG: hypothetical protein ACE5K8_07760, partial [Candidatus Zixiibacteriota bacterium]
SRHKKCHNKGNTIRCVALKRIFDYLIEFIVKFWPILPTHQHQIAVVKWRCGASDLRYVMQREQNAVNDLFRHLFSFQIL